MNTEAVRDLIKVAFYGGVAVSFGTIAASSSLDATYANIAAWVATVAAGLMTLAKLSDFQAVKNVAVRIGGAFR